MTARLLFLAFLFLHPLFVKSQEYFEGGLYVEHFQLGYRSQQQIGGQLHVGVGERFTLNWQAGLGVSNEGGFYGHAPAGFIGGMKLLRDRSIYTQGSMWNYLGTLLLVLPEGVGYYVTDGKMRMHVSVNPFGFDYWLRRDPYFEHGRMSGSVVFRMRLMSNLKWPIFIAPQVAATMIYRIPESGALNRYGFRVGVTIGLSNEER